MELRAYFTYHAVGKTIYLTDLSQYGDRTPTGTAAPPSVERKWVIDGIQVSTDDNPQHTFNSTGQHQVKLIAVLNYGGIPLVEQTDEFVISLIINEEGPASSRSIYHQVVEILPANTSVSDVQMSEYIRKNQEFIAGLVSPPIEGVDIYKESNYSPLVNSLLVKMTTYDILVYGANTYLASISAGSTGGSAQTKSITTGPTEVEWFDGSDQWSEIMSKGGLFDTIKADMCGLAQRLYIQLPTCPKIASPIIPMSVHPGGTIEVSPDNSFTT